MKQLLLILAIILLLMSTSVWSMSMTAKSGEPISFVAAVSYGDSVGFNAGLAIPTGIVPNLYGFTDMKYSTSAAGLSGRMAYIYPLKNWLFIGVTGGLNWMRLAEGDAIWPEYVLSATGLCFGKMWSKWGLLGHWEYVSPIDPDTEKVDNHHEFRLAIVINL